MRESIGASRVFIFAVVFLIAFTIYIAFSSNYSKTFKIKNEIVKMIERDGCFTESLGNYPSLEEDPSTEAKISKYLGDVFYATVGDCASGEDSVSAEGYTGFPSNDSAYYCVKRLVEGEKENHGGVQAIEQQMYYKVKVFFNFELPFLNTGFTFAIKGTTKNMIYETSCKDL